LTKNKVKKKLSFRSIHLTTRTEKNEETVQKDEEDKDASEATNEEESGVCGKHGGVLVQSTPKGQKVLVWRPKMSLGFYG